MFFDLFWIGRIIYFAKNIWVEDFFIIRVENVLV